MLQFSDYRGDTQEARDAASERWEAKQKIREQESPLLFSPEYQEWCKSKSIWGQIPQVVWISYDELVGSPGALAELEAEWHTATAQEKKKSIHAAREARIAIEQAERAKWINEARVQKEAMELEKLKLEQQLNEKKQWLSTQPCTSATSFTAMQLDLGLVLRMLKMQEYGIGKKHYTYEGGGGEPWTASPKKRAGGGVQPLWDALPAEIREAKCSSKKAALNKIKMGLAARLRRNATIEQCSALAVADAEALAKQEAWLASPKYQEQQAVAESKMKRRQALAKQKAWLASPEYQEQQALAEINMREQQARATYCVGTKVYLVGSGSKIIDGTITYMPPQISRDGRDIEVKWSGCGLSKYTFQELTDLNNAARGLMDSQINGAKELTKVAEEKVRTKVVAKYSFTKSSKSVYEEVTQQMEDYGETSCYTATITIEAFYGTVSLKTWTASSLNGGSRISGNDMDGEMQEDGTTLKITHAPLGWSTGSASVNMVDLVALAQKKGLLTVSVEMERARMLSIQERKFAEAEVIRIADERQKQATALAELAEEKAQHKKKYATYKKELVDKRELGQAWQLYVGKISEGDENEGKGTFTCEKTGTIYEGEFKFNKIHGHGTMTFTDGSKFVGEYLLNKMHVGIWTRADGTIRHSGEWLHGEPVPPPEQTEKKGCPNANNVYHTCTEYCKQKYGK